MNRTLAFVLVVALVGMLFAPVAAADLEYGDERADLEIHQPPWIDDEIGVDRTDNRTIYDVRGDHYDLELAGVNHSDVTRYGVADGEASFEYDEERDLWTVEPTGEGTIALYWIAEEPVDNGTETTRYAASLSVDDTEWVHQTQDEYDQTQQDAENWSAVVSQANSIDPDESVDSILSTGFAAAEFLENPTASISQNVQGVLIMMTMTPGGLLVLSTFLGLIAITAALGFRWRHRFKTQLGEHDAVQHELEQAWLTKLQRVPQQWDWPDLFPDHIAQRMHNLFGPNPWIGMKEYEMMRSPLHTKGFWLQMMSQIGYRGVVLRNLDGDVVEARALTREEIEAEYGADFDVSSGSDPIDVPAEDYDFGPDDALGDGGTLEMSELDFEKLRFDDTEHREIIDAIPFEDMDDSVFLDSVEIDPERLSLPIDNHNVDDAELLQLVNPDIPGDFESHEHFARVLSELLEFATNHPLYTDDDGKVRQEMDLLSFLCEMDSVLADKVEFPAADVQRKELAWIAEQMDPNARLEDTITDAQMDGLGREDVGSEDVIGPDDVGLGGPNPRGEGL